jgi:hypothetical protein
LLLLLFVGKALAPERPFLVKQATMLVEIFCWMLFFQLHGDCHRWRRYRRILLGSSLGFCDYGRSSFHVVGKVLVKIIRIVVIEVETMLRGITLRFLNFGDANHEDFTAKILNLLVLFT